MSNSFKYLVNSSLILIVNVVIKTLSLFLEHFLISPIRSSIWPVVFLISIVGSRSPVGLIIWSTLFVAKDSS